MADITQASIDKLNATLDRLIGNSYSTGGSNAGGSGIGINPNGMIQTGSAFFEGVKTFAVKVDQFKASIGDLANAVAPLGNLGGVLGRFSADLMKFGAGKVEQMVALNQSLSQYGATGTGNFGTQNLAMAQTRLDAEQYQRIVLNGIKELQGLGTTTSENLIQYGKFMDSPEVKKLFARMGELGLSFEQINEVAMMTIRNNKQANLSNEQTQRFMRNAMEDAALKMLANASAFGVTRQDQIKAGRDDQARVDLTARTNMMLRSGNPEEKARAGDIQTAMTTIMSSFGPTLRDGMSQALTRAGGGIYGETGQAIMQLAPNTYRLMQQIGRDMQTGTAEQRERAAKMMQEIPMLIVKESKDREQILAQNPAFAAGPAGKLYSELSTYTTGVLAEASRRNITPERAAQNIRVAPIANANQIITDPSQGPVGSRDRGALTNTAVSEINARIKDLGVESANIIDGVNKKITALGAGIDKLVYSEMLRDPEAFKKLLSEVVQKATQAGATAEEKLRLIDLLKSAGVNRADTTYGATGNPFEAKGNLLATINENPSGPTREGVFSQSQIDNIVRTALISGDSTKSTAPGLDNIGKVATKISDAVASAMPATSDQSSIKTDTQDNIAIALDGLNKSVMELVNLQKQGNKITESGLNKVANANSVYG